MFDNGTRFVWYGGGTQEEQVIKRALVDEMKTGLVTVHEAERGFVGEVGEGVGQAIQGIGGRLGVGGIFKLAGFDCPGAAEAPVRSDHLFDHAEFHAIGGLEAAEVVRHDGFETRGGFVVQDDVAGQETVAGGILRRPPFAIRGEWTFGASTIGL